jgi:hypothetical protein
MVPANSTETSVGHYLSAIRSLRSEVASVGTWDWDDEGSGCAVIRADDSEVVRSQSSATCNAIAVHSKVSLASMDSLIAALGAMDRGSPRTLGFVRDSARRLIEPLYPRRWKTLESAEGLLTLR